MGICEGVGGSRYDQNNFIPTSPLTSSLRCASGFAALRMRRRCCLLALSVPPARAARVPLHSFGCG